MRDAMIMLMDDEKPFVGTMAKRDLSVVTAYSGSEALEQLARSGHLDVVILDVGIRP
jgi:CheY-like chemotaxis protein